MPTYEYECKECRVRFEVVKTITDHDHDGKPRCPRCGGRKVNQVPSAFQVVTSSKA